MATTRRRRGRVVVDPKVMLGKPIARGTRIAIEVILERLGAGLSVDDVLEGYSQLRRDEIRAVLEEVRHEVKGGQDG